LVVRELRALGAEHARARLAVVAWTKPTRSPY
jgi:hypothetical protein